MRVTVNRLALQSSLAVAAGIAGRKTTMPILNNILLTANGKLNVTATDLQIAYSSSIACDADAEATIALPAKMLLDTISSLADKELRIDVSGANVELRSGKSRFKIAGVEPRDFPKRMDPSALKFTQVSMKDLAFIIETVEIACDSKTTNPTLQGISIDFHEGAAAASDGSRCAVARRKLGVDAKAIVHAPKDGLHHMLRAFEHHDTVEVAIGGSEMYVRGGDTLFGVKLLEVPFPHTSLLSFIRKKSGHEAVCARKPLIETLKRVGLVSNSEHGLPVSCALGGGTLHIAAKGTGEAEDDVECDYKGDGIKFRVSSRLLIGALDSITTEKVQFGVETDDLKPIYIGPVGADDHDFVIMGMR